ncbi:MAG: hypothetical protein HQ539_02825 [Parcubacteria group bacterium]|nr:hypothetical protein [Parcubacteria group bacterium]
MAKKINLYGTDFRIMTRGNKAFLANLSKTRIPTEKQLEVRDRFKEAVHKCKGQRQPEFSRCVGDEITVRNIIEEDVIEEDFE